MAFRSSFRSASPLFHDQFGFHVWMKPAEVVEISSLLRHKLPRASRRDHARIEALLHSGHCVSNDVGVLPFHGVPHLHRENGGKYFNPLIVTA